MTERRIWFERAFPVGAPAAALPDVIERLRGTPWRLRERTDGLARSVLTNRRDGGWSIQEHAGHLFDLEDLWAGRLDDLTGGEDALRAADLQNTKTDAADHNGDELDSILESFRQARTTWVDAIGALDAEAVARTSLHPRLRVPMTAVDLAFFVAEHDDHHLAAITELRRPR